MRARKGNLVFDLTDRNQIDAFRNSEGWTLEDEGAVKSAPVQNDFMNPPVEEEPTVKYSRSEIQRMSTADLKKTAISIGIEVTEESTGKALKEQICEKLGL